MERPLLSFGHKPLLVCSLNEHTVADTVCAVRTGIFDGADAFLLHMEKLVPDAMSEESLRAMFSPMQHRGVIVTNYRYENKASDDVIAEQLLTAVRAGASCVDLMCDFFDAQEPQIPTKKPDAVARQRKLIAKIHDMGAQVLISSHLPAFYETEALISFAKTMEERGADIVKIAMTVGSEEEAVRAVPETYALKKALHVPFYFGLGGKYSHAHRILAPVYGSCLIFAVPYYTPSTQVHKPLLRSVREIIQHFDFGIDR